MIDLIMNWKFYGWTLVVLFLVFAVWAVTDSIKFSKRHFDYMEKLSKEGRDSGWLKRFKQADLKWFE